MSSCLDSHTSPCQAEAARVDGPWSHPESPFFLIGLSGFLLCEVLFVMCLLAHLQQRFWASRNHLGHFHVLRLANCHQLLSLFRDWRSRNTLQAGYTELSVPDVLIALTQTPPTRDNWDWALQAAPSSPSSWTKPRHPAPAQTLHCHHPWHGHSRVKTPFLYFFVIFSNSLAWAP